MTKAFVDSHPIFEFKTSTPLHCYAEPLLLGQKRLAQPFTPYKRPIDDTICGLAPNFQFRRWNRQSEPLPRIERTPHRALLHQHPGFQPGGVLRAVARKFKL
jgi:hypothetical protein